MPERIDISQPMEVEGGDLRATESRELVLQRIRRGLFTEPGDVVHRPEWGAGLLSYQSEAPTPSRQQRLVQDAGRFLDGLSFVDDYRTSIRTEGERFVLGLIVEVDGEELEVPEIEI